MISLCLVTALPSEAAPWAEHFCLKSQGGGPLRVWTGDDVALVAGGVGRAATATAVGYLAGRVGAGRETVWLNAGIAGHPKAERGSLFQVARCVDPGGGSDILASLPVAARLPRATCVSVARAETRYPQDALYDMEAYGFFEAAARFSFIDLVHAVKVVSDNRSQGVAGIDRKLVRDLLASHVPGICRELLQPLKALAGELREKARLPELAGYLERWHFSVTRHNQLRALARDFRARGEPLPDPASLGECRSAAEVLAALRQRFERLGPAF